MSRFVNDRIAELKDLLLLRLAGQTLAHLKDCRSALTCQQLARAMDAPQEPMTYALMDLMADNLVSMVGRDSANRPLYRAHEVGPCEWCGIVSHHLVAGECPQCIDKAAECTRPAHARRVC